MKVYRHPFRKNFPSYFCPDQNTVREYYVRFVPIEAVVILKGF